MSPDETQSEIEKIKEALHLQKAAVANLFIATNDLADISMTILRLQAQLSTGTINADALTQYHEEVSRAMKSMISAFEKSHASLWNTDGSPR